MKKNLYIVMCMFMLVLLISCGREDSSSSPFEIGELSRPPAEYETTIAKYGNLNEVLQLDIVHAFPKEVKSIIFDDWTIIKEVYFKNRQIIKKGELILELDTTTIDEKIVYQKFELEIQEVLYQDRKKSGYGKEKLKIIELEIEKLELELSKLEETKSKYMIYAENDCYVIKGNMVKGRNIRPGESIFSIVNATKFSMTTMSEINLSKYRNVEIGDELTLDFKGTKFRGHVSYIYFDEKNYGKIYFEAEEEFLLGDKIIEELIMTAEFDTIVSENILTIPTAAIKDNQKKYIELMKDGVRRIRYIKCGLNGFNDEDQEITQILGGLREGESVIIKKKTNSDVQ